MTRRHQIFSLTVLISIVSLLLPLSASAATTGVLIYTVAGTPATVTIDSCDGACPAMLIIPATIDSNPVTHIGRAFAGALGLTSITIPSSVTSIGVEAFSDASGLTTVTFAGTSQLTSIGNYAFYGTSSLTSITIPSSVTSIGAGAFDGASSLTSITIPSGVTSISNDTFYDASSLTSITIPSSVTRIGNYAFYGTLSLTSITIPSSVTSIGVGAFYGTSRLTSVFYMGNVPTVGASLYRGANSELVSYHFASTTGWPEVGPNTWPVDGGDDRRATVLIVAPSAPSSVVGTSGDGQVVVSWLAPVSNVENSGVAITAYTVTASPGGQTCSWSTGPLSCIVTGLTNGVAYTFTVTATNAAGEGIASDPSSSVAPVTASSPATPVTLATSSSSKFRVLATAVSRGGVITVRVRTPGAGRVTLQSSMLRGVRAARYCASVSTKVAATLTLRCRPNATTRRLLTTRNLTTTLRVTFTATSAAPVSKKVRVTLRRTQVNSNTEAVTG